MFAALREIFMARAAPAPKYGIFDQRAGMTRIKLILAEPSFPSCTWERPIIYLKTSPFSKGKIITGIFYSQDDYTIRNTNGKRD